MAIQYTLALMTLPNVDINENVFYYDNDLGDELVRAIVDDKIDPGSKIHIGMLNDGEYWIEDAYVEIIEKLDFKKTVARKDHFKSKPINIGIITAHLKNHSVFNILIKGLILNLDRDDFSINIYCTDPNETIKYFRQEFIINSLNNINLQNIINYICEI